MERQRLVFILIALFSLSVSAENVEIDGICYNLMSKGNIAEVTGNHLSTADVVIPETVTYNDVNYSVTTIREKAFANCSLNSIKIPSSITKICSEAFSYGSVSSVKITDLAAWCNINFESYFYTNPLSKASHLFLNDEEIRDLVIPDGIQTISEKAFYEFSGLTSVKIPSSVTSIGTESFFACSGLKTIEIGDSTSQEAATVIGLRAFNNCKNVDSVALGNNIVKIGKSAFSGCKGSRSFVIPNSVKYIDGGAFAGWKMESIQLPENLNSIEIGCFSNCTNLKSIIIPDGVSYLGESAFSNCTNLTEVKLPSNLRTIDWCVFQYCTSLTSIELPDLTETIYICAFDGCSNLKTVTLGKSVRNIQNGAFANCPLLEEVYCKAKNPPTYRTEYNNLYGKVMDSFYGSYIEYMTLHVPAKSIETYKTTEPWSKFKNYVPITIPKHSLIYLVDGEVYKTDSIEEDEVIVREPEPVKEGYTFSGWSEIPKTMPANDVTVTGTFTINKYKLTYTVDGKEYQSYELDYRAYITPEVEPVKEGYTFSGWSEIPDSMPAKEVIITGKFTINNYKLTYLLDEQIYKTDSIDYATKLTAESEPTKEGYTFSGWSEIPDSMPAKDVTIIGSFKVNKYLLAYLIDDGSYNTDSIAYGTKLTAEAAPTKEGYTFSGWSEIPKTMPARDVTITGSFTVNKYMMAYLVDEDIYKTDSIAYGTKLTAEAEPKKEGYTFSGWSEIPDSMPSRDVTVAGAFTINSYKLTYLLNGEVYKSDSINYGKPLTVEPAIEREGYTFSGWSGVPTTMPATDVIVTATLKAITYTVTYLVDGYGYKAMRVDYGAALTAEAAPEKEGYTFSGWSEIPETMPAQDVTITGTFSINRYKLIYEVDGEEYKTYTIRYASTIIPISEPTKEGHTFSGWSEIPEEMPALDVLITGTFTVNKYKVQYYVGEQLWAEDEVEYGAKLTLRDYTPADANRYSFAGWDGEKFETMPAKDIEFHAIIVDGINGLNADANGTEAIYDGTGRKLSKMQRGVNVLRMKDGTTRKVFR